MSLSGVGSGATFPVVVDGWGEQVPSGFGESLGMSDDDRQKILAEGAEGAADGVVDPETVASGVDQAAPFQVGEMAGCGGLGEGDRLHDVADAEFTLLMEKNEDPEADRIGQCL